MKNIVYSRIDDRLIHGQVMTGWVQFTGATEVVIIDDAVAKDQFSQMVMRSSMPSKIGLKIFSVSDGAQYLQTAPANANEKIFILAKTPMAFLGLSEQGVDLKAVGIGGMGARSDRHVFYRNISASLEEVDTFKKLAGRSVDVFVQVIPDQVRVELKSIINK